MATTPAASTAAPMLFLSIASFLNPDYLQLGVRSLLGRKHFNVHYSAGVVFINTEGKFITDGKPPTGLYLQSRLLKNSLRAGRKEARVIMCPPDGLVAAPKC
jgi:hypothetical protein